MELMDILYMAAVILFIVAASTLFEFAAIFFGAKFIETHYYKKWSRQGHGPDAIAEMLQRAMYRSLRAFLVAAVLLIATGVAIGVAATGK